VHPREQREISLELHPALFGGGIAPPVEHSQNERKGESDELDAPLLGQGELAVG